MFFQHSFLFGLYIDVQNSVAVAAAEIVSKQCA